MGDIAKLNRLINKLIKEYNEKVQKYAEERFNKVILPYLQKYHLDFCGGQGWTISFTSKTPKWFIKKHRDVNYKTSSLDEETLPEYIINVLNATVDGIGEDGDALLGDFMPDYKDK